MERTNPECGATTVDPRVDSLAIPLAKDYAEQNYEKTEQGTFKPAWRGVNGEKEYKGKSPEEVAVMLEGQGFNSEQALAIARTMVIDIANTTFDKYSEYWKEANRGAARDLIELVDAFKQMVDGKEIPGEQILASLDFKDETTRDYFGTIVHADWVRRTDWMANEEIKDPKTGSPYAGYEGVKYSSAFVDLPPAEQQKDIDQLVILQKWILEQRQGS